MVEVKMPSGCPPELVEALDKYLKKEMTYDELTWDCTLQAFPSDGSGWRGLNWMVYPGDPAEPIVSPRLTKDERREIIHKWKGQCAGNRWGWRQAMWARCEILADAFKAARWALEHKKYRAKEIAEKAAEMLAEFPLEKGVLNLTLGPYGREEDTEDENADHWRMKI